LIAADTDLWVPGHRGRIGIIQPAPGVMLEHEWPRWLPDGVLFPVGRIRMPGGRREDYRMMASAAPETARDLASAGAGVVAYACTLGSLSDGPDAEQALVTAMGEAAGRPAISLAQSSCRALRHIGGKRLAILSPYAGEALQWVEEYVLAQGFEIAGFIATPVDIFTVGNLPPAAIAALACAGLADLPDADALWIPCTAIQTLEAIAMIEAIGNRPVISASQALLWDSLRTIGIVDPIAGAGRLLA